MPPNGPRFAILIALKERGRCASRGEAGGSARPPPALAPAPPACRPRAGSRSGGSGGAMSIGDPPVRGIRERKPAHAYGSDRFPNITRRSALPLNCESRREGKSPPCEPRAVGFAGLAACILPDLPLRCALAYQRISLHNGIFPIYSNKSKGRNIPLAERSRRNPDLHSIPRSRGGLREWKPAAVFFAAG
jgi:hypothetical protein